MCCVPCKPFLYQILVMLPWRTSSCSARQLWFFNYRNLHSPWRCWAQTTLQWFIGRQSRRSSLSSSNQRQQLAGFHVKCTRWAAKTIKRLKNNKFESRQLKTAAELESIATGLHDKASFFPAACVLTALKSRITERKNLPFSGFKWPLKTLAGAVSVLSLLLHSHFHK